MTIRRMDHMGAVIHDLEAVMALIAQRGLDLEGEAPREGSWVDRVVALDGQRS